MGNAISQAFPPKPTLTEKNLPSQKGKVFIVTGGYGGVGLELTRMLYNAGGKVYVAGRTESAAKRAIDTLTSEARDSGKVGELVYLPVDLSDLTKIKPAVEKFKSQESKLDVLFNNAAVAVVPNGSVSAQGHELTIATNALGPYLLAELLQPCLLKAAETAPQGSVRVMWSSSFVVDADERRGGFSIADIDKPARNIAARSKNYTMSKTANWYLAAALARQCKLKRTPILHVTQNPGNLKTDLLRHTPQIFVWIMRLLILWPAKYGGYTELWAGLSQELTLADNGAYVIPWGRKHNAPRQDLITATNSTFGGGTGKADEFLEWCYDNSKDYR